MTKKLVICISLIAIFLSGCSFSEPSTSKSNITEKTLNGASFTFLMLAKGIAHLSKQKMVQLF